jgi:hypothetical protein
MRRPSNPLTNGDWMAIRDPLQVPHLIAVVPEADGRVILITPYFAAWVRFSSTFNLPIFTFPSYSPASSSITGPAIWHGAHQGAQKSTITGKSLLITSSSKLLSVKAKTPLLSAILLPFFIFIIY